MVNYQFTKNPNNNVTVGNLGKGRFRQNRHRVRACRPGWKPLPVKVGGEGGYTTTRCYPETGDLTRRYQNNGHVWFLETSKNNQKYSGGPPDLRQANLDYWRETLTMDTNMQQPYRLATGGFPYSSSIPRTAAQTNAQTNQPPPPPPPQPRPRTGSSASITQPRTGSSASITQPRTGNSNNLGLNPVGRGTTNNDQQQTNNLHFVIDLSRVDIITDVFELENDDHLLLAFENLDTASELAQDRAKYSMPTHNWPDLKEEFDNLKQFDNESKQMPLSVVRQKRMGFVNIWMDAIVLFEQDQQRQTRRRANSLSLSDDDDEEKTPETDITKVFDDYATRMMKDLFGHAGLDDNQPEPDPNPLDAQQIPTPPRDEPLTPGQIRVRTTRPQPEKQPRFNLFRGGKATRAQARAAANAYSSRLRSRPQVNYADLNRGRL